MTMPLQVKNMIEVMMRAGNLAPDKVAEWNRKQAELDHPSPPVVRVHTTPLLMDEDEISSGDEDKGAGADAATEAGAEAPGGTKEDARLRAQVEHAEPEVAQAGVESAEVQGVLGTQSGNAGWATNADHEAAPEWLSVGARVTHTKHAAGTVTAVQEDGSRFT